MDRGRARPRPGRRGRDAVQRRRRAHAGRRLPDQGRRLRPRRRDLGVAQSRSTTTASRCSPAPARSSPRPRSATSSGSSPIRLAGRVGRPRGSTPGRDLARRTTSAHLRRILARCRAAGRHARRRRLRQRRHQHAGARAVPAPRLRRRRHRRRARRPEHQPAAAARRRWSALQARGGRRPAPVSAWRSTATAIGRCSSTTAAAASTATR